MVKDGTIFRLIIIMGNIPMWATYWKAKSCPILWALCLIIFNFYKLVSRITLSQVLLTMSLQFVASTYQSVGLNLIPSLVFVMALISRQEKLKCWSINGQAKIWGLVLSAAGALTIVLWKGPVVLNSMLFNIQSTSDGVIGSIMIIVAVLAKSFSNILVVK